MLKNRIIPCLDVKNGRVVKGINFVDLKDAGDPVEQAKIYSDGGADEICFLDITASNENRDTIYDVVKKIPLAHPPNQQYQYSNLAYFLLSMLVEEVSGQSLRDYTDERIFQPLGMSRSFFSDKPTEIVVNRASGYRPAKEGYEIDMTNLFWVGDGGLHTSIEDMVKWDQNFYAPSIGQNPAALIRQFNTPNSDFDSGRGGLYANGQHIRNENGRLRHSHSGGWLGTSTYYARYPEDRFSVIIFCNDVSQNPEFYVDKIAEAYFQN